MFMSNPRPVKCADILTISALNVGQDAAEEEESKIIPPDVLWITFPGPESTG